MPGTSPASRDRRRRVDEALDEERRRIGADRNQRAADTQVEPSHKGGDLPNRGKGLK